ncbi:glycoside hydrolase family 9 protein [Marinicellulosiphila megalodicopiae]|uniref:glycoside hydrolase family 9 protein n=1 Tax=Marinicellulosiphila megalodicopiae TaxID=2724896 RepID=UPI003BAE7DB6
MIRLSTAAATSLILLSACQSTKENMDSKVDIIEDNIVKQTIKQTTKQPMTVKPVTAELDCPPSLPDDNEEEVEVEEIIRDYIAPKDVAIDTTGSEVFKMVFNKTPEPLWSKKRIVGKSLDDESGYRLWDENPGCEWDDAEMFKINSQIKLPYGRKLLSVDIEVGDSHTVSWGGSKIVQFQVNGKELKPATDDNGNAVFELSYGSDGKGFVYNDSGTYWFEIPKGMTDIAFVNIMAAGATNYDVTLKNYTYYVWEEEDLRREHYLLHADRHGYLADFDKQIVIESQQWMNIESYPVTLKSKDSGIKDKLANTISAQPHPTSGRPLSVIDFSQYKTEDFYTVIMPPIKEVKKSKLTTNNFKIFQQAEHIAQYRDSAWSAFWWLTDGEQGPYGSIHEQDTRAQVFNSDKTMDVRGGWFDAGDYGKYSVNGAWSTTLGLMAYLYEPNAYDFALEANSEKVFPVSNHNPQRADALSILKYELDFLLKMQNETGAVHHKAATADWPSLALKPQDDKGIKTVLPISSTATADFATTMVLAYQVYSQSVLADDKTQAEVYLQASLKAYEWLDANPEMIMVEDRYDNVEYGGPYTDYKETDERLLADVTLWTHTKDPALHTSIQTRLKEVAVLDRFGDVVPDWRETNFMALFLYALNDSSDLSTRLMIIENLEKFGQQQIALQANSPWMIGIAGEEDQMNWGSNGIISTVALEQLWIYKLTGKREYLESAYDMSHWFFGLNPVSMDFITGKYSVQPKWPHFRPLTSEAVKEPYGLIVGGPNSVELKGDTAAAVLQNLAPMRVYVDHQDSWATNEIAINWQVSFASYMTLLDHYLRNRPAEY